MADFLSGRPAAPSNAPSPVRFVKQSCNGPVHHGFLLERERLLPFTEVPKHLPLRNGKRTHYSTIYRWATKGVRGHVLESFLVGGIRYTTHEAIERFVTHAHGVEHDSLQANEVDAALRRAGL